jgi:hypothetical protein
MAITVQLSASKNDHVNGADRHEYGGMWAFVQHAWGREKQSIDPFGGTSSLRSAWPRSTRDGAHRRRSPTSTARLTNVTRVGMTCSGARQGLS